VAGPAVNKHPGATAPTVHHQAVVQVGVAGVRGLNVRGSRQVSSEDKTKTKTQLVTGVASVKYTKMWSVSRSLKFTCGSDFPL